MNGTVQYDITVIDSLGSQTPGNKMKRKQKSHSFHPQKERRKKSPLGPGPSYQQECRKDARQGHDGNNPGTVDIPRRRIGRQAFDFGEVDGQIERQDRVDAEPRKGHMDQRAIDRFRIGEEHRKEVGPVGHQGGGDDPAHGDQFIGDPILEAAARHHPTGRRGAGTLNAETCAAFVVARRGDTSVLW